MVLPQYHLDAVTSKQFGPFNEVLDYTGSSPNVILVDFSGYAYAVEPFYPIAQIVTPKYPGNGDNIGYF